VSVVANVAVNIDAANAIQQLNRLRDATNEVNNNLNKVPQATQGINGVKGAIAGLAAQFAAGYTAAKIFSDSISTAFERGAAEQRLKNITASTEEYNTAIAVASRSAATFGLSQTEATKALADVYSRLKGVGFGLLETGQIYDGFNAIAKQSGMDAADASGAFFQLSQALGKGKLNGDEFVIVAERMPTLLDAIAQTTGRSRGELTEMASQGKITSQVLYQALSQAAEGATNLNAKLTSQQQAMNNLRQAADRVLYAIGSMFAPIVTQAASMFAKALSEVETALPYIQTGFRQLTGFLAAIAQAALPAVNAGFQFVKDNIKGVIQTATFFASFIGILKGIVFVTQAWTAATTALANAKKVAAVAAAALQAILNPASLVKIGIAIAGAAAASLALGAAMDAAANETTKVKDESKGLTGEIDQILNKYSSVPPEIESVKDKQEALKENTKAYKEEVDRVKAAYEQLTTAQDEGLSRIENSLKISEARAQAEQAVNNAIKQQLQTQLEQAKTQQEREAIANRIYQVEIANAESVLAMAKLQIQTEIDRAQIAARTQALSLESLQVELAIARARQQNTTELERALSKQQSALQIAFQNVQAVEEIAVFQRQQANATFDSQVNAAKLAFQQNITAKETAKAASSSTKFADNMERAGMAAEKTAEAVNKIVKIGAQSNLQGAAATGYGGAMSIEDPELQKKALKIWEDASKFAANKDISIMGDIFQKARDQIAQIALRDYSQKTAAASTNMAGSAKLPITSGLSMQPGGSANTAIVDTPPTINLQTGPVMQQGGQNYVTTQDLERSLQSLANQLLGSNRTSGGRRYAGVR
jgi:tape measure domain-containing protein